MRFSEQWLRSWVNPPLEAAPLAQQLTMAGLEVEEVRAVAAPFEGVVVGLIEHIEPHASVERLSVCTVNIGISERLEVLCGAPNARVGIRVPCAPAKVRWTATTGEEAPDQRLLCHPEEGEAAALLCTEADLALSSAAEGLLELPGTAPLGANVFDYLRLDDRCWTLKLTPNRADCLSIRGIAREVAILTGAPLKESTADVACVKHHDTVTVDIEAPKACGLYSGRLIRNLQADRPSPIWLKQRLERAGLRCVSALVDITNYVMLELGQPLHAYDSQTLVGDVSVRFARPGEALRLLTGQTVALYSNTLVIADAQQPLAVAGVMGGLASEATIKTQEVWLESAFFFPEVIAGRARQYGLNSEAAHRFERGVDPACSVQALERATELILEICQGEAGPITVKAAQLPAREAIGLRAARACRVIGIPLSIDEIEQILQRLGFKFEVMATASDATAPQFRVTPPSYRFDLRIEEDLIEELARIYGYERIPAKFPVAPLALRGPSERRKSVHTLRRQLTAAGYTEMINFSFASRHSEDNFSLYPKPIVLKNPMNVNAPLMRSTLLPGLLENLCYNAQRQQAYIRLFEMGKVFYRDEAVEDSPTTVSGYAQPWHIAWLAWGPSTPEQWGQTLRWTDYFDVKGEVERLLTPQRADFVRAERLGLHPNRTAQVKINGTTIGWLGELHPRLVAHYALTRAPILAELVVEPLLQRTVPVCQPLPRFLPMLRDVALIVDHQRSVQLLIDGLRAAAPALVAEIRLFDLYVGPPITSGFKSVALRLTLQADTRMLTDEEADGTVDQVVEVAGRLFDAKLRV